MNWLHRSWFAVTFAFGLAFVVVLPPFQSNDENFHWHRLWATAHGQIVCRSMTQAARGFPRVFTINPAAGHKIASRHFDRAWQYQGSGEKWLAGDTACTYFPTGYLPSALAARLLGLRWNGEPRVGGMMRAFYAARMVNWLLFSAVMIWALVRLPGLRTVLLAFYSIPEVLQQATAVNNDAFLFSAALALLVCVAARPRWSVGLAVTALVALMTLTKPVYAGLALLAIPVIAAVRPRTWRELVVLGCMLAPLPLWALWQHANTYDRSIDWRPTWNVDAGQQAQFLLNHPLHVARLMFAQLRDTFGGNLMHGSWRGIFGAFGWSALEMHWSGYYLLLTAMAAAITCDARFARAQEIPFVAPRWSWVFACCGIAAIFPGVVIGMYLLFTTIGEPSVNGVQGRYYLIPLLLLIGVALLLKRKRGDHPPIALALTTWAFVACSMANGLAVHAIRRYFYE
jgi:uncharacterized membrane protein